jgi:nitronate monooxygenase
VSLHTPLCDLLGIQHPIIQSGMGGVAGPDLVAEVARAGAFGILAGLNLSPDALREGIRKVRDLTDRPFGVNLWLHSELYPPRDIAAVPDATVRAVQDTLNRVRAQLDLPPRNERPASMPDVIGAAIEVILDMRPAVFSVALGEPGPELIRRCHARDIKVMVMVTTVAEARAAVAAGADVIVAQGSEAGGHRSTATKPASREAARVGTIALVPEVVDAVSVPVVAAGGMADGRGLVAALALGAQGILLGTRFVATRESAIAGYRKKRLLEVDSDATTVTDAATGLYARYLRNRFLDDYEASGAPVLPALVQTRAAQDIFDEAARRQELEYLPLATGQSVGLIRDLPGAGEVVETIVREARSVIARLSVGG